MSFTVYETNVSTGESVVRDATQDEVDAVAALPPTLTTSATTFAADGVEEVDVVLGWNEFATPPSTVDFDINGAVETVTVVDHVATLVLTSNDPGFIDITVEGQTTTVEAL